MAQTRAPSDPWHDALTRGHEPDHIAMRGLTVLVILFVLVGILTQVILWFALKRMDEHVSKTDVPRSVVRAQPNLKDAPPLQPSVQHDRTGDEDLQLMHKKEDEVFAHMGWSVDAHGHAQPPASLVDRLSQERNAK